MYTFQVHDKSRSGTWAVVWTYQRFVLPDAALDRPYSPHRIPEAAIMPPKEREKRCGLGEKKEESFLSAKGH